MLSVHNSYVTEAIITAKNHFIRTTIIMLPAQLFGLLMLNRFFLLILHRKKAIVVTMATKCNSHQQYSAMIQQLYHGLSPFLYKTSDYFWKGQSN
jgi:hypothetical protein